MRNHPVPIRLNAAISAGLLAANLGVLLALPRAMPAAPWLGLLAIAPVALTPMLWAMIHEAVHGELHPDRRRNDLGGRALAIVFGSPFQLLRLGHLMHHRHNRSDINRAEVTPDAPGLAARVGYFGRLLGGLYLGEALAAPAALLPARLFEPLARLTFGVEGADGRSMWPGARRQLLQEPGRSRMRLDGAAITALFALSFWLYGPYWWVLAAMLAGRAFVISFSDNAYHYGNPLDEVTAGHDLRMPRLAQALCLNFNYHATHHLRPNAPWTALPATQAEIGGRFVDDFSRAALRQLSGPIPEPALRASPSRGEDAGPQVA